MNVLTGLLPFIKSLAESTVQHSFPFRQSMLTGIPTIFVFWQISSIVKLPGMRISTDTGISGKKINLLSPDLGMASINSSRFSSPSFVDTRREHILPTYAVTGRLSPAGGDRKSTRLNSSH